MAWQAIGAVASSILQNSLNKDNAELSSATQYKYQTKLNKKNFKLNKKLIDYQNAFTERMYNKSVEQANTAHQREVADMRAAGLNPILSATGGNGATSVSPVSSGNSQLSSSAGMPSVENPDLMNAYSTHNQVQNDKRRVAYEEHNAHSQRNLWASQTDLNASETQKSTLEGDYQKLINENLPTQLKLQTEQSAASLAETKARTEQIKSDILNNKALTGAQVQQLISGKNLNETNSAKAHMEINGSLQSAARRAQWEKDHPYLSGFGYSAQAVAPALFGASAGATAGIAGYNSYKQNHTPKARPVGFKR